MASTTMATTIAMINSKCFTKNSKPSKQITQLFSMQNLPKGLAATTSSAPLKGAAVASSIFSTLSAADPAFAAQQLAEIAEGDSRGLALLLPLVPAVLWVLFNILQPALNQINRMRSSKGVIVGLGLGGLAGSGFFSPQEALAEAAAANDSRGQLLLFVVTPAIVWVLYNILQPALNQINRMRSQ